MAIFEKGELIQGWYMETTGRFRGRWVNDTEVYMVVKRFDSHKLKGCPKDGEKFQDYESLRKVLDFLITNGNIDASLGEERTEEDDFDPAEIMCFGC